MKNWFKLCLTCLGIVIALRLAFEAVTGQSVEMPKAGGHSTAADNAPPTKAELEEIYNAAYKAFDSNNSSEALKQLDAIDARQPDLAASKNLRGVILMRQGNYDKAETVLQEAVRIDPTFGNPRFNLAEIPFLKKDWAEARKRFEQLLSSYEADLAKEASQLIQYKILLTYLMEGKSKEGKSNMVDSILAKLELSPDTPAVDYVKAAVALQQKNEAEAEDWISAAALNYSPQINKLFVESLYEIGWMEKPSGQRPASLQLKTAAERSQETKVLNRQVEELWAKAKAGDADSEFRLGILYANGRGVAKDEVEGVKWYRKAAEQNHAKAQFNLGVSYASGRGMAKDEAEAVKWFRKAAERNEAKAQYLLGACYAFGHGVAEDYVESYKWFLLAGAQGDENAKKNIAVAESRLTREQIAEGQRLARNFKPQGSAIRRP